MDLPKGTVTLLFTDIEGSTRLLQSLGEGYAEVLAQHRDVLRATFDTWNGFEVDTQGDSFFVAFSRSGDALSAAAEAQLALEKHDWPVDDRPQVRMGLHTGEPDISPTGYVGVDVHRAARISSAAYGGQILLSSAVYELTGNELPEGTHSVELGHFRLKDLRHLEHLYELKIDDLPREFPTLRASGRGITNLPTQLTSFVGRKKEIDEIGELIADPDCRILTLVGPGGIGKTRLALESASHQIHSYADGTYFVPLAPLGSADHLVPTVAEVMQFMFDTHSSDLDPKSQLIDYLGERSVLLLMDNFEHLLQGAELLVEIVEGAPETKVLVTSRERLNLQSEWTFDVQGMRYPTNGDGAHLDRYSALQLFDERARQVDPNFELTEEVGPYASRICKLADGMPLGIELATAWIPVLSCREIAEEIEKSIDFLASTRKDLPDRHRSLRAAFEHSWKLLPDDQRAVFPKLSVFRGGFSRQAAAAIAGADIQLLSELMNKSLIRRNDQGRYEIHELLRQYAQEKLETTPGEENEVRQKHSEFYIDYLARLKAALNGENLAKARDELLVELENLRTAAHWCAVHWDQEAAREALFSLRTFYWAKSWHEGYLESKRIVEIIEEGRPRESPTKGGADPVYLAARVIHAGFMSDLGLHEESESICQSALPEIRSFGMRRELAASMTILTINAALRGDYRDSIETGAEAFELAKAAEQEVIVGSLHLWVGWDHYQIGEYNEAQAHFDESYQIFDALGNIRALAFALSKLGLAADASKDFQRAVDYHNEARDIFVKVGDRAGEAYTLSRLSMSLYGLGEIEAAIRAGRQGFEQFEEIGHRWGIGVSLCRIGFPVLDGGDIPEARSLFSKALERALEFKMEGLALYALGGLASVLTVEGQYQEALEVFHVFLEHPVTPAAYKEIAQPFIDRARADSTADEIESSIESSKVNTEDFQLEDFAREVLARAEGARVS